MVETVGIPLLPRVSERPQAEVGEDVNTQTTHGISRDEWVRRFKASFIAKANLDSSEVTDPDGIVIAELASWPEQDEPPVPGFYADWMTELPEAAADENLNNWTE